jgi:indole-3-glycerol phosphate synthase
LRVVSRPRRFSQAISEGDGISLIATVGSAEAARAAQEAGAEGLAVGDAHPGLRDGTTLPILWRGGDSPRAAGEGGADAWVIVVGAVGTDEGRLEDLHARVLELGLEPVVEVRDEEELEVALDRLDPEILLLSSTGADEDDEPLDHVLALLPDVPAGKLAIAEAAAASRDDVGALERAGIDGVLVEAGSVAGLAGGEPPVV